ncbi:MAG: bifunctional 2-C-methyl-D-erythritol 4-phosphate cytidylyltransferase/2-C-methyl-D-erythritol 2,4-cyclodiphosphate synthase [Minwuia sp.]|uniref:bifunctional 2-C-methyl-D-erythritol 4-phosphate cytidylyltransferase/2-C-methyl-D-erythritol 2,4-cyclodiphosphate synthase n=1 Tax=Minwuia sp. TaxID=2493630 RepID=UPI003A868F9D
MTNAAVIVAAGRGTRLGAPLPKQYVALGDGPVLRRTVRTFLEHPLIDLVLVVYTPSDEALYLSAVGDLPLLPPAAGGDSRQQSVLNGLEALQDHSVGKVLIHDAARPFVDAATITAVIEALETEDGALPVLPVADSIKLIDGGRVAGEVDRDTLGRAQTPQGFRFEAILTAHRAAAGRNLTDDAAVARAAQLSVTAVPGSERNFKITTAEDLERARGIASDGTATTAPAIEYRTGSGFDVHRHTEGRPMILCGIEIPYRLGLAGHSDADVGLHAITDALLGSLADGDIGDHFPPTDPQWKGAPSDAFLRFAAERVTARGGEIVSIDATLICEAPKIKPHRQAMRARIAGICGLEIDRVSVKATTTEKLGFTGRGEGIAAQAVCTVALPRDSA